MMPFGSVATWARSLVVCACLLVLFVAMLTRRLYPLPPVLLIPAALLATWFILQCLPLPVSLLKAFQPMARTAYENTHVGRGYGRICHDPSLAQSTILLWIAYAALTWACATAIPKRLTSILTGILVAIAASQAIWGIAALTSPSPLLESSPFAQDRAVGTFSSGNSFGGFIAISIVLTLGAVFAIAPGILESSGRFLHSRDRRGYKALALPALFFALAAQIVALILSGSRGAMLSSLLCSIALTAWFFTAGGAGKRTGTGRLLLLLLLLVFLLGSGGTFLISFSRFQSLVSGDDFSATSRLGIWIRSLNLLITYPLGVGPGCFMDAFARFRPPLGFGATRVFHAHSDYIETLCEWGVPGTLLLCCIFIWAVRRALALARHSNSGRSVWLWRGALMASVAGLLHSLVDFNISSRPGVAVFFFVLVGISLQRENRSSPVARAIGKRTPPRIGSAVLLGLVFVVLGVQQARLTVASWNMEKGFVALGGKPDPYFWLKPAAIPPQIALGHMKRAARIAPFSPWALIMLARGRILDYNRRVDFTVADNTAASPTAHRETVRAAVEVAMRGDHAEALAEARTNLSTALKQAPYSADAYAYQAKVCASLAYLTTFRDDKAQLLDNASGSVEKAIFLAPHDTHVLTVVCQALSLAVRANRELADEKSLAIADEMLKEFGQRALRTGVNLETPVLRSWAEAGTSLEEALESRYLPLNILWKAYLHYRSENNTQAALIALTKLDAACRDALQQQEQRKQKAKTTRLASNYFRLITMEKARLALRTGDLKRYAELLDNRRENLAAHIRKEIPALNSRKENQRMTFLALRRLLNTRGLDMETSLVFCRTAIRQNEESIANEALSGVAAVADAEQISAISDWMTLSSMKEEHGVGFNLARARIAMCRADYRKADHLLSALMTRSDLPFSLKHRICLLRAQCLSKMGFSREAGDLLRQALRICPTDPDVLAQLQSLRDPQTAATHDSHAYEQRLSDLTPEHYVGMEFFGGRATLLGFSHSHGTLSVFWRFTGNVPSDLVSFLLFRDDKTALLGQKWHFNKKNTQVFGAGNPQAGSVVVQTMRFGSAGVRSARLLVGLQAVSEGKWIRSSEGLPFLEIWNWQQCLAGFPDLGK